MRMSELSMLAGALLAVGAFTEWVVIQFAMRRPGNTRQYVGKAAVLWLVFCLGLALSIDGCCWSMAPF
jgi:hypothetical protein